MTYFLAVNVISSKDNPEVTRTRQDDCWLLLAATRHSCIQQLDIWAETPAQERDDRSEQHSSSLTL